MHIVMRACGAFILAAAVTASSLSAQAVEKKPTVEDRLDQIALVDKAVPVGQSPLERVTTDGTVEIESAFASPVTLALPVDGAEPVTRSAGRYLVPASSGATMAVTPTPNGAQVLVGIESAKAPSSFEFGLSAPEGFSPEVTADGSVDLVNEAGKSAAHISAPWAVDADGRQVPTRFELRSGSLTQVVDHRVGDFSYPIVADPKIFACDWYTSVCVKFTKKETKKISKKLASDGLRAAAAYLCTKIPHPMIAAVCVGTVVAAGTSLKSTFKKAAKKKQCVELHFAVPSGLLWKWKTEKC